MQLGGEPRVSESWTRALVPVGDLFSNRLLVSRSKLANTSVAHAVFGCMAW